MEGHIYVRNLCLNMPLGLDSWGRANKSQPVIVNVRLAHRNIEAAAESDDCSKTTSYSDIVKEAIRAHEGAPFERNAASHAHALFLRNAEAWNGTEVMVETMCPKADLRAEGGLGLRSTSKRQGPYWTFSAIDLVKNLKLACIIGVNPHERERKQIVVISLELQRHGSRAKGAKGPSFPDITNSDSFSRDGILEYVIDMTEKSSFLTVEALAYDISFYVRTQGYWAKSIISVEKPSAVASAHGCGVELHTSYEPLQASDTS